MNWKMEKTENANEVKLEITVEAKKFEDAIKKVYFKNAKYFNIPGFRKGKAPQNIVEKYYGKEIFYEDAFNEIASDEYAKAVEESKIDAVSKPVVDIVTIEKGQDLVFTAVVATKPEVKIEKYKGIEIEKIEYNVKDSDIEEKLKKMQEKNARVINVETPVEEGNTAVIDFEGFVDGVPFEGGKAENHSLKIGSGSFINGFEDQIIGMKLGEEKEISVKFPDDYFSKNLAGKDATFKVKVNEIKKEELPKLDDEFAKDVSEYDTLSELKNNIKEELEKEFSDKEKYEKEDAVIKAIIAEMKADIPHGMIEAEIDNMVKDLEQRMSYQGLKFEQYLKMLNKTEEDVRKQYEPEAIEAIKTRLALESIIEQEKIEATDEELKAKLEEMAKNYGRDVKDIENNEELKKYLKQGILNEKALDLIVKNSKVKKNSETETKKEEKKADKEEVKKETKKENKSQKK